MSFSYANIPDAALEEAVEAEFGDNSFALEKKSQYYNFICPFCGDPARPNKKKAYVYRDRWLFRCYKCGQSMHFMKYLKENDDAAYKRMLLFGFDGDRSDDKREEVLPKKKVDLPFEDGELISLLDHHPLAEQAVAFCQGRRIRPEVYDLWFVCQEGDQFLKRDDLGGLVLNEQGRPIGNEFKNRLIIPFYKYGGAWTQFDARALDPDNKLRYRNFEGVKRQAYNIDFLDVTKPFYILEGTIDSTFIRNAIAIGGISHFDEVIADNPQIAEHKENCTVIWDNDNAGELARIESVKKGYKWFNWSGIKEKDVNGAVLSGEMPVDDDGYVSTQFIEGRSLPPEGAAIIFALERGDMAARERQKQRETRLQLVQKMQAKQKVEVWF
ncbi:hypothetical protein [Fibrobacter sp.]|uniref:hypothetical protein n=1 Tax=Fibrobacter sp. TaxID=35828 RepID=UPI00386A2A2A